MAWDSKKSINWEPFARVAIGRIHEAASLRGWKPEAELERGP